MRALTIALCLLAAPALAESARRGIWASEFMKPWEWRRGNRLDTRD